MRHNEEKMGDGSQNALTDDQVIRLLTKVHLTIEQVRQLQCFRMRYSIEALYHGNSGQEAYESAGLSIWEETWHFMESIFHSEESFALYVPPIYCSDQLRDMLRGIYRALRLREVLPGVHATGHAVITGVAGTGKTTIVKAIAIAVAICSPHVFLLFVNYEDETGIAKTQWTIPYLLRELLTRYRLADVEGAFGSYKVPRQVVEKTSTIADVLAYLRERCDGLRAGVIADEIQEVVKLEEESSLEGRKEIMSGLQSFARLHGQAFIILTGSSSRLRECLVEKGRPVGYEGFPDFNHDLFRFYTVSALRSVLGVKSYFQQRYGRTLDDSAAVNILYRTGGIGRWMHDARDPHDCAFPDRSAESLNSRKLHLESPRLMFVIQCLREYQFTSKNRDLAADVVRGVNLLPEDVRVPLRFLMTELPSIHDAEIGEWVDQSILFRHTANSTAESESMEVIELAVPVDAVAHFSRCTIQPRDYMRLYYSYEMVYGTDKLLGAGNDLEALMRPRVTPLLPLLTVIRAAEVRPVDINAAMFITISPDGFLDMHLRGLITRVTAESVHTLAMRTWRWEGETGLDAVQFSWDASTSTLTIHGWQCKGGRAVSYLGGGTPSTVWQALVAAAVKRRPTDGTTLSAVDFTAPEIVTAFEESIDNLERDEIHASDAKATLAGYIVKAAIGFSRLARPFLLCIPDANVRIGTFVLTASMIEGPRKDSSSLAAESKWKPPSEHCALLGFSPAQWARCSWNFDTTLHLLESDWISRCLEPELRTLWDRNTSTIGVASTGGGASSSGGAGRL